VTRVTRRTNAAGQLVVYVRATRTGNVTLRITKSGYVATTSRLPVRR
jgi:hypothetical protein